MTGLHPLKVDPCIEMKMYLFSPSIIHFVTGEEKKSVDERKPEEGDNSNSSEAKNNQSGDVSEDKGRHSDAPKDSQTENFERKRESTESKEKDSSAPKKPKMMMNFVKSSDSL